MKFPTFDIMKNKYMNLLLPPVFLASGSPRRSELLKTLDLEVRQKKIAFEEKINPSLSPEKIAESISFSKAQQAISHIEKGEIILTADTLVFYKNEILAKPRNAEEAVKYLTQLSGNRHTVITGVTMGRPLNLTSFSAKTDVYFSNLSEKDISYYVKKYRPYDKAGAYGIQEWIGWAKIYKIEGSFSNVMGLPTHEVYEYLTQQQEGSS